VKANERQITMADLRALPDCLAPGSWVRLLLTPNDVLRLPAPDVEHAQRPRMIHHLVVHGGSVEVHYANGYDSIPLEWLRNGNVGRFYVPTNDPATDTP
jgi:hypothetical protein